MKIKRSFQPTLVFINCRSRLKKVLAGVARGKKGCKSRLDQVSLLYVDIERQTGLKYKLICHFKKAANMVGGGIREFVNGTDRPGKGADEIGCGWVPVGQSTRTCKWTGAHLHVSRAYNPFLQCKMHYISYIGVGTLGWTIYN